EVGEYVGICSLESDLRIVEPRHLRIALDMEITCAEMEQSCGRPRIVGADANRVGQDMRPDTGCSRNRIIEPVVVWSVGLSSRPISGHLQPRTQRMIDLHRRNLRYARIQCIRHVVIRQTRSVWERNEFLNLQRNRIE